MKSVFRYLHWPLRNTPRQAAIAAALLLGLLAGPARAYSVLSHEAVVDALWDVEMKRILLKRFPHSTPAQLREAHAYAYGGAIIQDMGYYPFGSHLFSDLTHYVWSGDFIVNLIADSETVDEYAFALGALSHYVADDNGHPMATNKVVPMLYPRLRKRFGDTITYEDNPVAHVKTEFGFDVLEVAKGRFAPAAYHDFVGFQVSKPLLARAFRETYCLELTDLFDDVDLVLGSYRRSISKTIPLATRVAWAQRKDEIQHAQPGLTRRRFLYYMSRSSYHNEFGSNYEEPGWRARFLAFLFRLVPKIGPLKTLTFHMPTPAAETLFEGSFNVVVARYTGQLEIVSRGLPRLPDMNFDLGRPTVPGTYPLTDDTYAQLVDRLAKKRFAGLSETAKTKIEAYYKNMDVPFATKNHTKQWRDLLDNLRGLKGASAALVQAQVN